MESFVHDRGRDPHVHTLFDDAQHTVFNELLPFWAGFVTAMSPSEREGKRPGEKNIAQHKPVIQKPYPDFRKKQLFIKLNYMFIHQTRKTFVQTYIEVFLNITAC